MRKKDHPKIRAVVKKILKDTKDRDILHPAKLGLFTLQVAKELSKTHKWYKAIQDSSEPGKVRLYRSLLDHISDTYEHEVPNGSSNASDNEMSSETHQEDPEDE